MAEFTCSECGGELQRIGKLLRCTKCKREKTMQSKEQRFNEVDMNDETKDMDVLME